MENEEIINFATANNTATHLGRKLYSSISPAIAELIANSYDAYATHCDVRLDVGADHIVIADDGIGMSIKDLKERYVQIGQQKIPVNPPEGLTYRSPMGKKGIGKLAAFSLGNSYTVYTRTGNDAWEKFSLNYAEMIKQENSIEYRVPVERESSLPKYLDDFQDHEHGMIIIIEGLRVKRAGSVIAALKRQIPRRFFLSDTNFQLTIDGDAINMTDHRALFYDKVTALNYAGYGEDDIWNQFSRDRKKGGNPLTIQKFNPPETSMQSLKDAFDVMMDKGVRAWVGVIDKPKSLKEIGLGGVVVYINGKVADEDFLKEHKDARIGGQYICGEVQADFLNEGSEEPITSSRQGLDENNEEVNNLTEIIRSMQSKAIDQWNRTRETHAADALPDIIKNNEKYQNWRHNLKGDQRRLNNSLLKILSYRWDFEEDKDDIIKDNMVSLVNSFTQIVESSGTTNRDLLQVENSDDVLDVVAHYLSTVATVERLGQASLIEKRLQAIKILQDLMKDPSTKEKAFQEHLFENPWLINPFWNRSTRSNSEIRIQRERFTKLYDEKGEDYKRRFIDIYLEAADEPLPIVVELKKNEPTGHAKVNSRDIIAQIDQYREALLQEWEPDKLLKYGIGADAYRKIPGYFIISEDIGITGQNNRITFRQYDLLDIENAGIKLLTYSELVKNAQSAYREFLQNLDSSQEKIPYIPLPSTDKD